MAKVGTAIIEVKPVLNEEALLALSAVIEAAVYNAVSQAMSKSVRHYGTPIDKEGLSRVLATARSDVDRAVQAGDK